MSEKKKPREFWMLHDGTLPSVVTETHPGKYAHQYIHVIEKSAYDELVRALEKAQKIVRGRFTSPEDGWNVVFENLDASISTSLAVVSRSSSQDDTTSEVK